MEQDNYYAFGMKHDGYNTGYLGNGNSRARFFKYNGKELNAELDLDIYDYGARNYDSEIGRWFNIDPKAELLEISSPYVYALNCPIVYVDRDGELPILINGKTSSDSERGSATYWGTQIINTIKNCGIANPGGEFHYVDGNRGIGEIYPGGPKFIGKGANYGLTPNSRREGGKLAAQGDWNTILSKLAKDPKTGKITEKIQIYTHSRGAAFGQGYTDELIKENSAMFADANNVIDFVFDMAPHQSDSLTAATGVDTYSMDHYGDPLSDNDKSGVQAAFTTNEGNTGGGKSHKIATFQNDIKEFTKAFLSSTTSQGVINAFVKNMRDKYNIKVDVRQ